MFECCLNLFCSQRRQHRNILLSDVVLTFRALLLKRISKSWATVLRSLPWNRGFFVAIKSKLNLKPSCSPSTVTDCAVARPSKRETGVVKKIWSFAFNSPCVFIAECLRQRGKMYHYFHTSRPTHYSHPSAYIFMFSFYELN